MQLFSHYPEWKHTNWKEGLSLFVIANHSQSHVLQHSHITIQRWDIELSLQSQTLFLKHTEQSVRTRCTCLCCIAESLLRTWKRGTDCFVLQRMSCLLDKSRHETRKRQRERDIQPLHFWFAAKEEQIPVDTCDGSINPVCNGPLFLSGHMEHWGHICRAVPHTGQIDCCDNLSNLALFCLALCPTYKCSLSRFRNKPL